MKPAGYLKSSRKTLRTNFAFESERPSCCSNAGLAKMSRKSSLVTSRFCAVDVLGNTRVILSTRPVGAFQNAAKAEVLMALRVTHAFGRPIEKSTPYVLGFPFELNVSNSIAAQQ